MTHCPEGAFTSGHLWMGACCGAIVMLVVVMILRNAGVLRDPPAP